jgi:hypothetical protein
MTTRKHQPPFKVQGSMFKEGPRDPVVNAGRTAQEYNQRKGRQGAFWEDRYHATAIEIDEHLHRRLV